MRGIPRGGLQSIATIMKTGQTRQVHTQRHEILNELARLDRESSLLGEARINFQEMIKQIDRRLTEMEKIEKSLQRHLAQMTPKGKTALDVQDAKPTAGQEEIRNEMVIRY